MADKKHNTSRKEGYYWTEHSFLRIGDWIFKIGHNGQSHLFIFLYKFIDLSSNIHIDARVTGSVQHIIFVPPMSTWYIISLFNATPMIQTQCIEFMRYWTLIMIWCMHIKYSDHCSMVCTYLKYNNYLFH